MSQPPSSSSGAAALTLRSSSGSASASATAPGPAPASPVPGSPAEPAGPPLPLVELRYAGLRYSVKLQAQQQARNELPSVFRTIANVALALPRRLLALGAPRAPPARDFLILDDVSGVIRPGTLTLVLAPPGHGKSAFLKALTQALPKGELKGEITYSGVTAADTGQGGELMGFYNMGKGDAPYFNYLAQHYAISDNYHQAIMGGTGANFFALATGDVAVYNNAGNTVPPANQIENPNPQAGTANFYTQDGYSGGSYVNCYDQSQPGVASIMSVLNAKGRASNCAYGAYYLVNNYNPPYAVDGTPQALGATTYTYPPQTVPTIGEKLYANNVSFKWYTGGRDTADVTSDALYPLVRAQVAANPALAGAPSYIIDAYAVPATQPYLYNSIGDPMNASSVVQANAGLKANLKGLATLKADVTNNTLPAVSFVVPKNLSSGHPGYSIPGAYEAFLQGLISQVQSNPTLWANTAIIVTTDEGGGYFDSGYIQNVDFFGDGPRIPLLVVSPFTTAGNVDHTYHDHASILKFIERNWQINTPLSSRSRDRLPNPVRDPNNPYRPANEPAIGDLMTLFTFPAAPQIGSGTRSHEHLSYSAGRWRHGCHCPRLCRHRRTLRWRHACRLEPGYRRGRSLWAGGAGWRRGLGAVGRDLGL